MNRTVYLHIGATKTGSSALQAALVRNREWLDQQGFRYPASSEDDNAGRFRISSGNGMILAKGLNPNLSFHKDVDPKDAINNTIFDIRQSDRDRIIFSSEHLMFFIKDRLRQFYETLTKEGIQVEINFWVRNIMGHALSAYSQRVKRQRYTDSFLDFARTAYNPNFLRIISSAGDIVGRDRMMITSYDANRGRLFAAFCGWIGANGSNFEEVHTIVNRSLSRYETEVMRILNQSVTTNHESMELSDAIIYASPDKIVRQSATPEELGILRTRFTSEVDAVNAYFGTDVLSVSSHDVPIIDSSDIVLTEFEQTMLSLIVAQNKKLINLRSYLQDIQDSNQFK